MSAPQRVQVFGLGVPAKGTPIVQRRYRVKWRIDGGTEPDRLKTRAEAERFRRHLLDAVEAGEVFDPATGEPASWAAESLTWLAWSQEWLGLKWRHWAGTTRRTAVETLVTITPLMTRHNAPPPPEDLATWLCRHSAERAVEVNSGEDANVSTCSVSNRERRIWTHSARRVTLRWGRRFRTRRLRRTVRDLGATRSPSRFSTPFASGADASQVEFASTSRDVPRTPGTRQARSTRGVTIERGGTISEDAPIPCG